MEHWLDKVVALLQADTADLRELARMAGGNPKTFYRGINPRELDLEGQNIEGMDFAPVHETSDDGYSGLFVPLNSEESFLIAIDDLIHAIRRVGRQEERLALLLKLILENRSVGVSIIGAYGRDKAKYANRVLAELGRALEDERAQMSLFEAGPTKRHSDDLLARILQQPFSRGMPGNRSGMLYYMAMHLSNYPKINAFLKAKLENSYSIFLNKEDVRNHLDNPHSTQWVEFLKTDNLVKITTRPPP